MFRIRLLDNCTQRKSLLSVSFVPFSRICCFRYVNDVEKRLERLEAFTKQRNELRTRIAALEAETGVEERRTQKVKGNEKRKKRKRKKKKLTIDVYFDFRLVVIFQICLETFWRMLVFCMLVKNFFLFRVR